MATSKLKIQGINSAFPGCCGATILHGLIAHAEVGAVSTPMTESAQFAVTNSLQTVEIQALRAEKFVPLATWTNKNSARLLTLWGKGVKKDLT